MKKFKSQKYPHCNFSARVKNAFHIILLLLKNNTSYLMIIEKGSGMSRTKTVQIIRNAFGVLGGKEWGWPLPQWLVVLGRKMLPRHWYQSKLKLLSCGAWGSLWRVDPTQKRCRCLWWGHQGLNRRVCHGQKLSHIGRALGFLKSKDDPSLKS